MTSTPQMSDAKLVTLKELSQILGKSEASIRYHYRMGRILPSARFGRVYSFNPAEVMKQLQRGTKINR